jgi:serine/threonine protein kinase
MLLIEESTHHIIEDGDELPYEYCESFAYGNSGSVEKVRDRRSGRVFARKTIWIRGPRKLRKERERTIRNEVRIIRGLKQHRHIIQIFATYIRRHAFNIILHPVADKGDLARYLENYHDAVEQQESAGICGYNFAAATSILQQAIGCLASGLAFMREQRVRHRDVKPQNILVHNENVLYTDFGYSRDCSQFTKSSSEGAVSVQTPRYSAPEVISNKTRSYPSDVFSLGCVFMEILSALYPGFSPDPEKRFAEALEELHEKLRNAQVPSHMSFLPGVIASMIIPSPEGRATAQQIYHVIREHDAYSCRECYVPPEAIHNEDSFIETWFSQMESLFSPPASDSQWDSDVSYSSASFDNDIRYGSWKDLSHHNRQSNPAAVHTDLSESQSSAWSHSVFGSRLQPNLNTKFLNDSKSSLSSPHSLANPFQTPLKLPLDIQRAPDDTYPSRNKPIAQENDYEIAEIRDEFTTAQRHKDPQFEMDPFVAVENHNTFEHRLQPNWNARYPNDDESHLPPPPRLTKTFPDTHPREIDRKFPDTIEDKRDDIRDTRERLMGARFRLQTKRHELKATREDGIIKAGIAFNRVKMFLLMQGLELPPDIHNALDDTDTSRDILYTQETEYEEAEDNYNLEEWLYTDKETKFLDDLFSTLSSSPIAIGHPPDRFGQAQIPQIPSSVGESGFAPPLSPVLSRDNALVHDAIASSKPNEHAEYAERLQIYESPGSLERPFELDSLYDLPPKAAHSVEPFERVREEHDLNFAQQKWSQTRDRIDKWILEAVDNSKFQKAQLRNHLLETNFDDTAWWRLVVEHWSSTSPSLLAFHTGDSTISEVPTDRPPLNIEFGGRKNLSATTPLVNDRYVLASPSLTFPGDFEAPNHLPKREIFGSEF